MLMVSFHSTYKIQMGHQWCCGIVMFERKGKEKKMNIIVSTLTCDCCETQYTKIYVGMWGGGAKGDVLPIFSIGGLPLGCYN